MTGDTAPRLVALVLVVSVAVGAGVTDRVLARPAVPATVRGPAAAVVSGSDASSSAWYCAGGAGAPAGTQAAVVLTNPLDRPVTGAVDAVGASGPGTQGTGFEVPPDGQLAVPVASGAASRVVLHGGGIGALEVLSGPLGWTAAPCASTTASNWYFAHGSTSPGRALQLSLYNPTPSDAVVDVTFVSAANGVVTPPAYQGLPVPAGGVVVENVSDHVQNDPSFSTEVSALSGTVVAAETAEVGGQGGGGLSLVNGVLAPERQWAFAQNTDVTGGGNTFSILNPSKRPASVTVSIALAEGQAAPLTIAVPAMSVASFAAHEQTRIPPNAPFSLVFTSNGPGVVVSRETFVPSGALPTVGFSVGVPGGTSRWLVPPIPPPGTVPWSLGVVNLTGTRAHVTVSSFDSSGRAVPLSSEDRVVVGPRGLLEIGPNPGPPIGRAPLLVTADRPVALELDPEPVGAPGTVVTPAWALLGPGA